MPEITQDVFHPNSAGSGSLGLSDQQWGSVYAVILYQNGNQVAVLASPAFTGTPTAPTAGSGTATTQLATCAFVQTAATGAAASFGSSFINPTVQSHMDNGAIHLTEEEIRDAIATTWQDSDSIDFTHDDGADTYTAAVRLSAGTNLSAAEAGITSGTNGLAVTLGTAANTCAAGNDSRFPSTAIAAGFRLNNYAATSDPTTGDDSADGYGVGSIIVNISASPQRVWCCVDPTEGAAVWVRLNSAISTAELETELTSMLVGSDTIDVVSVPLSDQFYFNLRTKTSSLGANEGLISQGTAGAYVALGTSASRAAAGNDSRFPSAAITASLSLNNLSASADPTAGDDSLDGYSVNSVWVNNTPIPPSIWACADATAGTAIWHQINSVLSSGTTGGTASAGTGNQYVELTIGTATYKVLHDGTV